MIEQLIESIIEAEHTADEIVKKSNVEAKQLVAMASENALKIIKNANGKVKDEMKLSSNEANILASKQYEDAIILGNEQATQSVFDAQTNESKAVEFVIRSFKAKYGNC